MKAVCLLNQLLMKTLNFTMSSDWAVVHYCRAISRICLHGLSQNDAASFIHYLSDAYCVFSPARVPLVTEYKYQVHELENSMHESV